MKLFFYLATTTISVSSLSVIPVQIGTPVQDEIAVPVQIGAPIQDESVVPVQIGASVQDESVVPIKIGTSVQDESVVPIKIGTPVQDESVVPIQIGASIHDECYTKQNGKLKAKACVFPFFYKGAQYSSCTTRDSSGEVFWCGTVKDVQVGHDGNVDPAHVGDCDFAGSYYDVFPCLDRMDGTPVRTSCGHACAFRQGEGNGYCQADGTCWKTTWTQAFQACIQDGLVNSFEELVDFIPQDLLPRSG